MARALAYTVEQMEAHPSNNGALIVVFRVGVTGPDVPYPKNFLDRRIPCTLLASDPLTTWDNRIVDQIVSVLLNEDGITLARSECFIPLLQRET